MYEFVKRALTPVSVPCYNFMKENGERYKRTVIISPIRFQEYVDGSISISWACSSGVYCQDSDCRYSSKAKQIDKVE
jgi:hypothetical protein